MPIADLNLVTGTLKGFDQLMNVVLDDVKEIMRGKSEPFGSSFSASLVLERELT